MVTKVFKKTVKAQEVLSRKTKRAVDKKTVDSYINYSLQLGVGANNQISNSSYGFNPITRYRVLLEWIHRGSWLGGIAIDVAAEDMIRGGIEIHSTMDPTDIGKLQKNFIQKGVWNKLTELVKWARLYGGAIAVMLIDGQDLSTPLNIDSIGKDQFKGLYVFDRWMCQPTLNQEGLVEEYGPDLGNPKYYMINNDAPALRGKKIHYSRIIRMVGVELPFYQKILEQYWGLSVLERLFDRLVAFDSATSGIAQYIHKMHLRVIKIDKYRHIMAAGNKLLEGFKRFTEDMRMRQSNEGITFIDSTDDFVVHNSNISSGISEALMQLGQQIAGALQMPLVRLFGQSPTGLNSSGESDLRTYYEGVLQKQERDLRSPLNTLCAVEAKSSGIKLPEEFGFNFRSLWALNDEQKSGVFDRDTRAILEAFETNVIDKPTALKELRQLGRYTNRWTNISDAAIEEAENEPQLDEENLNNLIEQYKGNNNRGPERSGPETSTRIVRREPKQLLPSKKAKDDAKKLTRALFSTKRMLNIMRDVTPVQQLFGLPIVIECKKGEKRWEDGPDWPSQYGFIASQLASDGDELDCFVGDDLTSTKVFVFNHLEDGEFDELKIMLGYNSFEEALDHYEKSYGRKPGKVSVEIKLEEFNYWLAHTDLTKPVDVPKKRRHGKNTVDGPSQIM